MSEARKLAAILAADVAGFSRLIGIDEDGTLARLRALFGDVIEPAVAAHRGRIVKRTGDGALVEFRSVVDAVRCAVVMQRGIGVRNAGLAAGDRMEFRIGIHLGDVVEESDGDLMGDGVNIAARLESLAEPGAISLSEDAYRQVKSKIDLPFRDLGEMQLKNIAESVRVYALETDDTKAKPATSGVTRWAAESGQPDKPSIAVLPFTNMSDDLEQQYFSDGISEDIITELSRFKDLLVVARNSSFVFRNAASDLRDVSRKLGARYLVEGSVRKIGGRIRITVQLIDGDSGTHLWAERYDRDLAEVLKVQDEVARTIVSTIGGRIESASKERAKRLSDEQLQAYDLYLRAAAAEDRNTRESYEQARQYLLQAIERDPALSHAHHHLSLVNYTEWMVFWSRDRRRSLDDAIDFAKRALALDDSNSSLHAHYGMLLMGCGEYDEAAREFARALSLNPNDSKARALHGYYLTAIGRTDDALASFEIAERLNPFQPDWTNWLKGVAYFTARRYREAILTFKAVKSPMNEVRGWLAASHALAGEDGQARAMLSEFLRIAQTEMVDPPDTRIGAWKDFWFAAIPYRDANHFAHLYEGLRKAGLAD